jgi:DNA polymerase (family 10)
MPIANSEIGRLFDRYAVLLDIDRANPFRVRAYRNAARTIAGLPRSICEMVAAGEDLDALPGIGKDLAHKLAEIAATGRFAELDAIEKRIPGALADLADVPGLGPKRVRLLYDTFKIKSMGELAAAVRSGKLMQLHGFGPKLADTILKAVEAQAKSGPSRRITLFAAEQIAAPLVAYLKAVPGIRQVTVAGSFRRRRDTVGDLDILVTARDSAKVMDAFAAYADVAEIQSKGPTRATVILKSGLQVDLRCVDEDSYGAALVYFTGSKPHNIELRLMGIKRHLKINEYGVFRGERRLAGRTEKDVYGALDLACIEPELRENTGEIEAAATGRLPKLVTLSRIRGDLHVHTKASDGNATIEEMARAALARGYEYVAISDHTKHLGITHGMDARQLVRQIAAIDRLNAKSSGFRILKSAEVDILPDGKLAMDHAILGDLDFVIAAVHTKFTLDAQAQTERIIRAMDDPRVNIIAHPTGRLIGEREAYAIDMAQLMKAALERGCHLEVNGQPARLDLNESHCRLAKELGLKLALGTDAHAADSLGYMRYAVDQARRGWLEPRDILNTRPWPQLKKLLAR